MHVLTAFFPAGVQTQNALGELTALGVTADDISILPPNGARTNDVTLELSSKAAEGIATGAVTGSILGALAGYVSASGALVIPAVGSVLTGSFVAAFALAGVGATFGIAIGALIGAHIPEIEATLRSDIDLASGTFVAVRCPHATIDLVAQTLEQYGASFVRRASVNDRRAPRMRHDTL